MGLEKRRDASYLDPMSSATTASAAATSLRGLLRDGAGRDMIRSFLNGLSARERVEEALSIRTSEVGMLYQAMERGPQLALLDFVPKDTADEKTIIFHGRNSLPAFSSFQKRFARMPSGEIVGYNHQTMAFVTGPGVFVVKATHEGSDIPGELYFDYTAEPTALPAGWPAFKSNTSGLSTLVYGNMKDYMRAVADNVVVGTAYKKGKAQGQYFVLCHE